MAASHVNTKMALAIAANEAGDLDDALTYARSAQGYLAALPNSARDRTELEWDHRGIENFVRSIERAINRAAAASTGIQRTRLTYAEPAAEDDYA